MADAITQIQRASTTIKLSKCDFTWTIKNYSFCPQKVGEKLVSPKFSSGGDDAVQWNIELYPNGNKTDSKEFIGVYLSLCDRNRQTVKGKFNLSLLNDKCEKTNVLTVDSVHEFHLDSAPTWGWTKFVKIDDLKKEKKTLLPNDTLTIKCELCVIEEVIDTSEDDEYLKFEVPGSGLLRDMKFFRISDEKFTDVTLSVGEKKFKAHKAVLASRSKFFAKMFESPPPDGDTEEFAITDIEDWIFNEILNFIYTDTVENIDKKAKKLLVAAARFDLDDLRFRCENLLANSVSVDDAIETLLFAHDNGATVLRSRIIDFINEHTAEICPTPSFVALLETHPRLVVEIATRKAKSSDSNDALTCD